MKQLVVAGLATIAAGVVWAHGPISTNYSTKPILAESSFLKALNIPILATTPSRDVAFAQITPEMEARILDSAHQHGKCAGFEALPDSSSAHIRAELEILSQIEELNLKNRNYSALSIRNLEVQADPMIEEALSKVDANNLRETVQWLSSFKNRNNKGSTANVSIAAFRDRLQGMTAFPPFPITVELINHRQTAQKSIRLRIQGKDKPNEIVVLGAHIDSIAGWGANNDAPGADDNASGSANLLETLRILLQYPQPQRTIEFYWYAGEESGLLGSAEIADDYKNQNKQVVAVLQLDMTLLPGDGELTIASMTDFTSAWLRDYLKSINDVYLKARVIEDKCGYGCSDHASWYRRGFPTLMPFEAKMDTMNRDIHTARDVITPRLSFSHSAVFTKIALLFGLDLANSEIKQPY